MPARQLSLVVVVLLILFYPLVVCGQSDLPAANENDGHEQQSMPSIELLEFLGEWETENGQWFDHQELDQMRPPDQDHENEEDDHS